MKNYLNFLARHSSWIAVFVFAIILLYPAIAEYRTVLMVCAFECLSIALASFALFAFTKIDFIQELNGGKNDYSNIISSIFLGVHLLVGLVVLGVYIAQFTN